MIDLDEMKQKWAEYDEKLDKSIRLNWELLKATKLNDARSALQRMSSLLALQTVIWFAIAVALGNFIYANIADLRFALPGIGVDVYAISMLAAAIGTLAAARQIDYRQPIVAIQRQIETLRVKRIRMFRWGVLAGMVAWAPFSIVMFKVLLGINDYSVPWLWANIALGLAQVPLVLWLSKRFGDRMRKSLFIVRLMRDIAGNSLSAAEAYVASLSEFEQERRAS